MRYIKIFEGSSDSFCNDIMSEIPIVKEIEQFFKKNNLDDIEVKINNNHQTKLIHIFYDYFENDTEKMIFKLVDGKKEDIMVGIPRYKGLRIYTKILNFLNNMSTDDIEFERSKKDARKYNL